MKRRTLCAALAGCAAAPGLPCPATAQDRPAYPARPVRLVMPYPPGGGGDVLMRPLLAKLGERFGQPVLLDYKPGASTMLGTELVARAEPDGYTMGFITDSHLLNPIFNKTMRYDAFADFSHVTQLVGIPLVLVMHPSMGIRTIPELVKFAKSNPGKLAYASLGLGTPQYLYVEYLFKHLAGIDMLHVPYQGTGPALHAVLANQVQVTFIGVAAALQHVKDGRVVALGTTPASRLAAMPNIPSISESGFKEFDVTPFYGLTAPAKTPPDIVSYWATEIGHALRAPDMADRLATLGLVQAPSGPREFTEKMRTMARYYERMVKVTGAKGE